jgi:hypothetical protein
MAKKAVAAFKTGETKNLIKVIKMVKSPKTGAYTFKEEVIAAELLKDFLNKKE